MTHEQRTAIARIISDMIKADNIIEESEIRDMKQLMDNYSLTQHDMCAAHKIRFSDAVNILKELSPKARRNLFEQIYNISISDNICVPREALLLLALQYCLVGQETQSDDNSAKPYLISCATGESSLNDLYMVYLESTYDEQRNQEIEAHFRLLVTISRLCGFHFIYIPRMVSEFRNMNEQYVMDVISYMAPGLDESFIKRTYDRLCKMTTRDFFRDVLYERLQVRTSREMPPSILINIGTSVVPYCSVEGQVQYYTEFLCIPIISDALSLVDNILDFYQSKVSVRQTITLKDGKGQFKYFGFYKALFDFLIAPPPVAPDLIFLGQNRKTGKYQIAFKFEDGNEKKVDLAPKEYKTYRQIAEKTYGKRAGGLSIGSEKGLKPTISHIRNKIQDGVPDLTYINQYKPERVGNMYVLRLDKSKVFIRESKSLNVGDYEDIPIMHRL